MLSRHRLLELFTELDVELARTGIHGEVFVVGGAAMVLAYDARPATRDIDAIWHPADEVRTAAQRIAERHTDLGPDWLNDGVKGFLPPGPASGTTLFEGEHLSVAVAPPDYLLATKLLASRTSRDEDDIRLLLDRCGLTTVDEALELLERFYPGRPKEAKIKFFLEELLGASEASSRPPGDE